MRRNIEQLLKRIREELRAEGPDGSGFSDFLLMDAMNSAIEDLGEVFPVRDTETITTEADTNTYSLAVDNIIEIIKVVYNGTVLQNIPIKEYLALTVNDEGDVDRWTLWGTDITFIGEVEADKTATIWMTRNPNKLFDKNDIPETPSFADEGIIAYALSVAYREAKDYQRADYHYGIYLRQKDAILKRSVPQGHRDNITKMSDNYWGKFQASRTTTRSDTNPGGSY